MKLLLSLVGLGVTQDLGFIKCTQGCVNQNRNNPYGLLRCQKRCDYGAPSTACENGIHLNDEDDTCRSFYRCNNGVKLDIEFCPDGTRFDEANQRCLWADTVPCKKFDELVPSDREFGREYAACLWSCNGSTDRKRWNLNQLYCYVKCKDKINPPEADLTLCEDGTYRSENSCSSFYTCQDGIRFQEQSCPDGLYFDGENCNWPTDVGCSIENYSNPAEAMINKPCETGIYQVRGSPDKFYQCTKGIKHHEQSCPAGLLFNEADGICDWPHNVEVLPAETASSCYDGLHGLYWYQDGFYYCYDNVRYYDQCPGGLTFDNNLKKCVWPREILAVVGDLEISSETIKDVKEIQSFFSCFWECGYGWYGWYRKSLKQKYKCSNRCLRRAARNRREIETCQDGFEVRDDFYIECREGIKLPARSCPKGLRFDLDQELCVPLYWQVNHL